MRRGFSFVEVIISVAVLGVLTAGIYALMNSGASTYNMENGYVQVQQDVRRAMERMTRELREASRGNFSNTGAYPHNITFNTLNATGVQYYCDYGQNQLIRQHGATVSVMGSNVQEVNFTKSGDLVSVWLSIQKPVNVLTGIRNIDTTLGEKVRLRND